MNNLPKVVARQCRGRESNPRSADRESGTLTTIPLSHPIAYYNSHIKNWRKLLNKGRMKQVTFEFAFENSRASIESEN